MYADGIFSVVVFRATQTFSPAGVAVSVLLPFDWGVGLLTCLVVRALVGPGSTGGIPPRSIRGFRTLGCWLAGNPLTGGMVCPRLRKPHRRSARFAAPLFEFVVAGICLV